MQTVQSYNTAISRKTASAPLKYLDSKSFLNGAILDYGCGKGADLKYLKEKGYTSEAYDPHWRPVDLSGELYDTVLCTYVFNVISANDEAELISSIKSLLHNDGAAYISVRRDLKKEGKTSRGFQRNVILDLEVVKENSGYCIYKLTK
jgi:ATP adenylyltransferase